MPARCFVSVFWKILGKNVEVSFLRAGMACPPPKSTRRIRPPGVKTSEGTLRQNAEILFSEINCKQIANGAGEKCGGPAGHEIGEENRPAGISSPSTVITTAGVVNLQAAMERANAAHSSRPVNFFSFNVFPSARAPLRPRPSPAMIQQIIPRCAAVGKCRAKLSAPERVTAAAPAPPFCRTRHSSRPAAFRRAGCAPKGTACRKRSPAGGGPYP